MTQNKERVRYIGIRFISSTPISEKDAWFIVSNEIKRLYGTIGAAEVGLFLSYYDPETQGGVFRSSHLMVNRVRSALCFLHTRRNEPLYVFAENTTGSLKKAKLSLHESRNITRYQQLHSLFTTKWNQHTNDDQ